MAIKRKGKLPIINIAKIETGIATALSQVGNAGVRWAIQNHEFRNRTLNLEDSYGYAVYKNGNILGEPFVTTPKATSTNNGESGHDEAVKFLSSYHPASTGWTLVVTAAASYASFVEFMFGLDVLQGSAIIAEKEMHTIFKKATWIPL